MSLTLVIASQFIEPNNCFNYLRLGCASGAFTYNQTVSMCVVILGVAPHASLFNSMHLLTCSITCVTCLPVSQLRYWMSTLITLQFTPISLIYLHINCLALLIC